jgi:hypothetical protein
MKSVHLVIPDLFLPKDFAAEVSADLSLPALQKLLGRGHGEVLVPAPLENLLCELFDIPSQGDAPIAPISAAFDGLAAGCWLRADPVHLRLQRDQMLALPIMEISAGEAGQMCASLNGHFAGQGMEFIAPHPQRWYVHLDALPRIRTTPFSQVIGGDVRRVLPTGEEAARWHQLFNEIQMLLFAHPLNEAREARGELPINSVWFWGGGCDTLLIKPLATRLGEPTTPAKSLVMAKPADCGSSREAAPCELGAYDALYRGGCGENAVLDKNYDVVSSDDVLAEMFAKAAGVPFSAWPENLRDAENQWRDEDFSGKQLLVWTGLRSTLQSGDLAAWRAALQDFENSYAQPLWQALRAGKIAQLQLDILGVDSMRRVRLTRGDAWAFWRRSRRLAELSMV